MPSTSHPPLSQRALNRATLARQMLLERSGVSALEAIEALVGLQAQAPNPPYYGLWSRLDGFRADELVGLFERREVVRIAAMRSTVHLMSASDAIAIRPLLQPMLVRALSHSAFGKQLSGIDVAPLIEAGRALLSESPRTGAFLATTLGPAWPSLQPQTIQNALRTHLALVQVPPRGLWGRSGQPTLTTLESWLASTSPPATTAQPATSVDAMVLRYLAAFGPASTADVQAWSGLTRLGEVIDRLRPDLVAFTAPSGATVYDLPAAPRPDPDTPAPVRLIAEFDNLTLSYADRTRVLSDEDRRRAYTVNGIVPGMVLVDGVVTGSWKLRQSTSSARLEVTAFRAMPAAVRAAVRAEARALLAFAATTPNFPDDREVIWSAFTDR